MNEIPCPACSDSVPEDHLCPCANPLCLTCCLGGEHHWLARDKYELENGGDAA